MSELTDHRDQYLTLLAEAHGNAKSFTVAESVLPAGHFWTPHVPKVGPLPTRMRRPSSPNFAEFFS